MLIPAKTVAAACALGALLLTACGPSSSSSGGGGSGDEASKDPQTILSDAAAAMKSATDAHIKGTASSASLDGDLGGGNYNGSVSIGGKTYNIVVLADPSGDASKAKVFMKAGADVWNAAANGVATIGTCLGDKWVEMDTAANADLSGNPGASQIATGSQQISAGVQSFSDFGTLSTSLTTNAGTVTKGSVQSIDGQNVIELKNGSGSVFVANSGSPYVLRITGNGNQLDITNWNSRVKFSAPDGAQPLSGFLGCFSAGG